MSLSDALKNARSRCGVQQEAPVVPVTTGRASLSDSGSFVPVVASGDGVPLNQSSKVGSQRFRHTRGAHLRDFWASCCKQLGLVSSGCPPGVVREPPLDFTDHHVSHLLRLSSQAGSLCVSSAFGNGGVVSAETALLCNTFRAETSVEGS